MLFDVRRCPEPQTIATADMCETPISGSSSLKLKFPMSDHVLRVNDVVFMIDAGYNLISSGKLDDLGTEFKVGEAKITMIGTD